MNTYLSGIPSLDSSLFGSPGIPGGSIVEIYGPTDSCKTALALWYVRSLHRSQDTVAAWVATESTLTPANLRWAGVCLERLYFARQSSSIGGLDLALRFVEGGADLVVIDSLAGVIGYPVTKPLREVIGKGLPPLVESVKSRGTLLIFTNQTRILIGGRSRYHAGAGPLINRLVDVRIELRSGPNLYRAGRIIGTRVTYRITRNGSDKSSWGRTGQFNCYWASGLRAKKGERNDGSAGI